MPRGLRQNNCILIRRLAPWKWLQLEESEIEDALQMLVGRKKGLPPLLLIPALPEHTFQHIE